jgi:hypothetical protein
VTWQKPTYSMFSNLKEGTQLMAIYTPKEYLLENNIVTSKGKINGQLERWDHFKPHIEFIKENCHFDSNLSEMIYCIYHELSQRPVCPVCFSVSSFQGFQNGYSKYCSKNCYWKDLPNYDYGFVTKNPEKRKALSRKAADSRIRKGSYNFSEIHKENLSKSAKKSMPKKRKTNKEKYGVENPGVMGGLSSKAANIYIKTFIAQRNIDIECCYFHDEELNKKEFFQMIRVPNSNKLKYVQYDLVVFKDKEAAAKKNLEDITLVLEYNGPWHYTLKETLEDPYSPTTPYRKNTNNTQKTQSFIVDKMKRIHLSKVKDYYTFWEKDGSLRKGTIFI